MVLMARDNVVTACEQIHSGNLQVSIVINTELYLFPSLTTLSPVFKSLH